MTRYLALTNAQTECAGMGHWDKELFQSTSGFCSDVFIINIDFFYFSQVITKLLYTRPIATKTPSSKAKAMIFLQTVAEHFAIKIIFVYDVPFASLILIVVDENLEYMIIGCPKKSHSSYQKLDLVP